MSSKKPAKFKRSAMSLEQHRERLYEKQSHLPKHNAPGAFGAGGWQTESSRRQPQGLQEEQGNAPACAGLSCG